MSVAPRTSKRKPRPSAVRGRTETMNLNAFAAAVRDRRQASTLSQRQAAAEAGVSFSTFSRVEAGNQPDLASFALLCAWLHVPAATFFTSLAQRETSPLDAAITHLKADPRLPQDAAQQISGVLRDLYNSLATHAAPRQDLVACHLRAATAMRPGVPERLAQALQDMHHELRRQVEAGEL